MRREPAPVVREGYDFRPRRLMPAGDPGPADTAVEAGQPRPGRQASGSRTTPARQTRRWKPDNPGPANTAMEIGRPRLGRHAGGNRTTSARQARRSKAEQPRPGK